MMMMVMILMMIKGIEKRKEGEVQRNPPVTPQMLKIREKINFTNTVDSIFWAVWAGKG